MFGLTSVHTDLPIKKPWAFATNDVAVVDAFFNNICSGHNVHSPCQGQDTKLSENYTSDMVRKIHDAHIKYTKQQKRRIDYIARDSTVNALPCCRSRAIGASLFLLRRSELTFSRL